MDMDQRRELVDTLYRVVGASQAELVTDLVEDWRDSAGKSLEAIRELLSQYDFPGDEIPIIKSSALVALEYVQNGGTDVRNAKETQCLFELMDAVDEYIDVYKRQARI